MQTLKEDADASKCDVAEKIKDVRGIKKRKLLQWDVDKIFSVCIFVHSFMERVS